MLTKEVILKRACCLAVMHERAQVENQLHIDSPQKDHYLAKGEKIEAWVKENSVLDWLSDSEQQRYKKAFGQWTPDEILSMFWRVESFKALAWAANLISAMPNYFAVESVEVISLAPHAKESASEFLERGSLLDAENLERERHYAEFLNWRCRTEMLKRQGTPAPNGDTYPAVIRRAIVSMRQEGYGIKNDGNDILVQGVAFKNLPQQAMADVMFICYERHLALNWLTSDDENWENARADT